MRIVWCNNRYLKRVWAEQMFDARSFLSVAEKFRFTIANDARAHRKV